MAQLPDLLASKPATLRELIVAVEGYRQQLDAFALHTSMDLLHFKECLEARLHAMERQ